jgi:hypothetical protein
VIASPELLAVLSVEIDPAFHEMVPGHQLQGFMSARYRTYRGSFGTPQSLGCVELPLAAAAKVWPYTPIGTLVTVER